MNPLESIRIAVTALAQNRARALLTTLGVIIGVSAVIGMITLGEGVKTYVTDQFQSLGANLLTIASRRPVSDARTRIEPLTMADIEALSSPAVAPSLSAVTGQFNVVAFLSAEGEHLRTNARGVAPEMTDILSWKIRDGQFISADHVARHARVIVLGEEVVEELYGQADWNPVGATIRLNNQAFLIIGVMERRQAAFTNDNIAVFVPISTAQTRLTNAHYRSTYKVSVIYAQARSEQVAGAAGEEIDAYFYASHNLRNADEKDYTITNRAELLESVDQILGLLTVFLGMIASVSLLVGGIGIMNIMLVTVTERTREIGLRKAVGARPMAILMQFLFESIILSLAGGTIGVLLAAGFAMLTTTLVPDLRLQISPGAVALATIVSISIGVGFGVFPAHRAARLNPIEALRYE
jgi:putative ABC transport system permease protein